MTYMMESTSTEADNMLSPSMLDLFLVTFNCGKDLIDVKPFASALYGGLKQNATDLPELVVFSLQEISPITYAYIGPYFLGSYYSRFEEALNLAATKVLTTTITANGHSGNNGHVSTQVPPVDFEGTRARPNYPYTLVRAKNVGMTAVLLFARDPTTLHHLREAETGFGVMDMGNKGAVGLRVTYSDAQAQCTELTFVAAHLTHGEAALQRRNENWEHMVSELTFENPKKVLSELQPSHRALPATRGTTDGRGSEHDGDDLLAEEEPDTKPLLDQSTDSSSTSPGSASSSGAETDLTDPDLTPAHTSALQNISMFKPSSHLFVAGDLNYRISSTEPKKSPPPIVFPSFNVPVDDERHWSHFLARDQLSIERAAGRACHGLSEADINFGPSYKYDHVPDSEMDGAENAAEAREKGEVAWKWAPHRWPSWCDRILFMKVAPWVKRRNDGKNRSTDLEVKAYDIMPLLASSDHRPVFLRVHVPVLSPEEMTPPHGHKDGRGAQAELEAPQEGLLHDEDLADPRITLPYPINIHSWDKRAAGRSKELWVGWNGLLWSTKQGGAFLLSLLLIGSCSWLMMRNYRDGTAQI